MSLLSILSYSFFRRTLDANNAVTNSKKVTSRITELTFILVYFFEIVFNKLVVELLHFFKINVQEVQIFKENGQIILNKKLLSKSENALHCIVFDKVAHPTF